MAPTLVAGVVADIECAWNNYVAAAAHHSDEYMQSSGNFTMKRWGLRQITADETSYSTGSCTDSYGLYTPLQTARFQAASNYARIQSFPDGEVPDKASLLATIRAYGAFSLVAMGEGFCEIAMDGGEVVAPADVLALAETWFGEAIELAGQAGDSDILGLALVGRARVRLDLEDFGGAIADAEQVPATFAMYARRDESDPRRYNAHYDNVNGAEPGQAHATVAPNYRALEWMGVDDPRVNVFDSGNLGFDFVTPHYVHDKIPTRASPVLLASYEEAQLFIAEAAARANALDRARAIINAGHALAGLPSFDAAGTTSQDEVIAHVIEERRRELFVEGGHRLNDMLRFRGTAFEIPFLGEPGSIHPNGIDHVGNPYGTVTCFPLPDVERSGNPNIPG